MKKKAESGEKTEEEYKQYYETGYKTDVEKIVIDGANGTMEFTKDGNAAKGTYEYRGYQIYDYKSGSRGVRYFFEKTSGSDEAPRYVQFSDHGIAPERLNTSTYTQETRALMPFPRRWTTGRLIIQQT